MLIIYKCECYLKCYCQLSLNERINAKYSDYRTGAYSIMLEYNDDYLLCLLPHEDHYNINSYKVF